MLKRSESDMLEMRPIKVRLGKKDYEIPTLNNRQAAAWRDQLYEALGPLISTFDFGGIDLNANQATVSQMMSAKLCQELIQFPEKLSDLLFAYAPSLPKDEILEAATDEQIGLAFAQVAEVGYPFFFHLWAAKRALTKPPQPIPPQKLASPLPQ
jgi:hypothetical protein